MRIAIVCSNYVNVSQNVGKGTEIFDYILINNLASRLKNNNFEVTVFASGDSKLPLKVESIASAPSISDSSIIQADKHIIFELALISSAFLMEDKFDLYHANIGDGDIILPFAPYVKKPILVTLHYTHVGAYVKNYFSLFRNLENLFFVSISNSQRKFFPELNYAATIHHGIEEKDFAFDQSGGGNIMWAGRGTPDKGLAEVFKIVEEVKRKAKLFILQKQEHLDWVNNQLEIHKSLISSGQISIEFDKNRQDLISDYQSSKLFLYPVEWEEPFGLVLIESMSCGTPVVVYARGSIPEIIKDGETGFIVNPSDDDKRGDWIIRETGLKGLLEAVERIYSMPTEKYLQMRRNCRSHVEKFFTAKRMMDEYIKVYRSIAKR
ncbi:MAG: hypothetical protein A2868_03515 [Candidatus Levybacteria bacterium RIFCSPHIGHO2_01_FULL_40_15b]|nr:MAG: hypothetical protein A2868_03515 [Candidatus Levybacteria bacterium RIFCSPHIGHO2_01_FULL_40_15b]